MRRFGFASLALVACTASGSDNETHGPVYDNDGSAPLGDDAGVDGTTPNDATVPGDASDATTTDTAAGDDTATGDDTSAGDDTSTPVDAGPDAPSCSSLTALFGGSTTAVFGAVGAGQGALTAQSVTGAIASAPAIGVLGGVFQGLVQANNTSYLESSSAAGTTWTALATLPGPTPVTIDPPAVALVGSDLHAVYLGGNDKYYHATFNGTAWDNGSDPVGNVGDGGAQAFGPGAPAAAGLATGELVAVYQGSTNNLYAQSWTSAGGWVPGVQIGTATLATVSPGPVLVALGSGATHDLLVVYSLGGTTTQLYSYARTASSKAWNVGPTVITNALTSVAPSLAAMSGARAVLAWEGTDGHPYTSTYVDSTGAWSAPAALVAGTNPTVSAAPALAIGNCGDDAVAAFVSGGAVSVTRLNAGTWSTPATVSGASGVSFVSVATSP